MEVADSPYHLLRLVNLQCQNLDEIIGREFLHYKIRARLRNLRWLLDEIEMLGKAEIHHIKISLHHLNAIKKVEREYQKITQLAPSLQIPDIGALCHQLATPRKFREDAEPIFISPREKDVLFLLSEGLSSEEIAQRLSLKLPTVKSHLTSIYRKMGVTSKNKALLRAKEIGLLL